MGAFEEKLKMCYKRLFENESTAAENPQRSNS